VGRGAIAPFTPKAVAPNIILQTWLERNYVQLGTQLRAVRNATTCS